MTLFYLGGCASVGECKQIWEQGEVGSFLDCNAGVLAAHSVDGGAQLLCWDYAQALCCELWEFLTVELVWM